MVYEVPASKASIKQNRFEFRVPGSRKTHSVPKVQYIKPSALRRLNELAAQVPDGEDPSPQISQAIYTEQMALFEHYVPGFEDMFEDSMQIGELFNAWQAESNISLGESSASSAS